MKSIVLTFLMLVPSLMFSQFMNRSAPEPGSIKPFSGFTRIDYARILIPEKKNEIEGNIYVFENWNNRGVLSIGNEAYKLGNINFNMRTNKVESRVGKDSVYIFDLTNVDYLFINNRKFKNYYFSKNNRNEILELIYDGEDLKLLKGFEIGIKRGEVDPLMVKKTVAKFYTTTFYYINKGDDFNKIKLKKKDILLLFNDKVDLVRNYIKENKLSYTNEKNVIKLFNHYNSL